MSVLDRVALGIATVAGAGYAPVASGTVGSLVACVALWLIPFTAAGLGLALAAVIVVGIWAGSRVERTLGAKDPGVIVIDEVAGMFVSVLFLPRTLPVLATAFVLFRLFDIWKPFPARESQVFTGGVGVMLDDLIAGAYTLVLIAGARALFGVPR
jgi:phosphatidylglycerophosphatase A